jgi:hypothetical protein
LAQLTIEAPDISAQLLELILLGLSKHDNEWIDSLAEKLRAIFVQWKDELGTRLPRTRRGAKGLRTYRAITFEEATPYECADPATGVTDYVSLCLHLVKISYPPLDALLESEDFLDVISVSARIEPKSVNTSSLLWVTGMVFRTHVRQSGRDENFRQCWRAPKVDHLEVDVRV